MTAMPSDEFFDGAPANEGDQGLRRIQFVDAADIFAPLPELRWAIEGLRIPAGAVTVKAGYGFSMKTLDEQERVLCKCLGLPVYGVFATKAGRCAHFDLDQGRRVTFERYQRLLRAKGIDPRELQGHLRVALHPDVKLDATDAVDVYARAIDGFEYVTFDCLRAGAPTIDENTSEIRRAVDVLNVAAEKTGAAVNLIHHSKKPTEGTDATGKFMLRGSSAIFDAAATVFLHYSSSKGDPVTVAHHKCRVTGVPLENFALRAEDVQIGDDPRGGLRIVHLENEQLQRAADERRAAAGSLADTQAKEAIRSFLRKRGGRFEGSKTDLRDATGIRRSEFFQAFEAMRSAGEIALSGGQRDRVIAITERT